MIAAMVLNEKNRDSITSEVGSLTRMHNEAQCAAALLHKSQLFLLFYFIFAVSAGLVSQRCCTGNTLDATILTPRYSVRPVNFGLSLQRG